MCRPKASGGLGVINLRIQGNDLLLKYLHKFYNGWDTPWVQLSWETYYTDQIPYAADPCGSFWWRDVAKLMPTYRGISMANLGNGRNVHDCILCGLQIEERLEQLFFDCHFSSDYWSHLGLSWHPGNSRLQNVSKAKEDRNRPLFMELFLLAAWSIWKEHNNKHFRGGHTLENILAGQA